MDPQMMQAVRQATRRLPKTARSTERLRILAIITVAVVASMANIAQSQTASRLQKARGGRSLTIHPLQDSQTIPNVGSDVNSQTPHYYGVLGSVNHPGVYVTGDARLKLATLVEAAQGLTPDAAEIVSVVRHGRAGLKFRYKLQSDQRLQSGDVIVVSRRQQIPADGDESSSDAASVRNGRESIKQVTAVAFVGLVDGRPIISSLYANAASLPQIIANLYQRPEIIQSVRVIHSDISTTDAEFDPLSDSLTNGDVIVFNPADVDQSSFARAGNYPPAIPVDSTRARPAEPSHSVPTSPALPRSPQVVQLPDHSETPKPVSDSLTLSGETESPLPTIQPKRPPDLLAPTLPEYEPVATVADGPDLPSTTEPIFNEMASDLSGSEDVSEPPSVDSESTVAPILLVETIVDEQPVIEMDPLPAVERFVPAPAEPQPSHLPESTDEPSERIALQVDPVFSASKTTVDESDALAETEVPIPVDRPADPAFPNLRSKATVLGFSVLAVALLCFMGSLLWSKLDESSGRMHEEQEATVDEETSVSPAAGSQMLNRLIANQIPMIEEEVCLPERLMFHGEVVGRRRLRIDLRQEISGPHFPAVGGGEAVVDQQATVKAASATSRNDSVPTHAAARASEGAHRTPKPTKTHGLLERVLVAMEREKRR
jgi:hypothetical protein